MKTGELWWVDLGKGIGREQNGFRPALIVSSDCFAELVETMTIVIPCTTRNRNWLNHVFMEGHTTLNRDTYAMTEQLKAISQERLIRKIGEANQETMDNVQAWINRWLG